LDRHTHAHPDREIYTQVILYHFVQWHALHRTDNENNNNNNNNSNNYNLQEPEQWKYVHSKQGASMYE